MQICYFLPYNKCAVCKEDENQFDVTFPFSWNNSQFLSKQNEKVTLKYKVKNSI